MSRGPSYQPCRERGRGSVKSQCLCTLATVRQPQDLQAQQDNLFLSFLVLWADWAQRGFPVESLMRSQLAQLERVTSRRDGWESRMARLQGWWLVWLSDESSAEAATHGLSLWFRLLSPAAGLCTKTSETQWFKSFTSYQAF